MDLKDIVTSFNFLVTYFYYVSNFFNKLEIRHILEFFMNRTCDLIFVFYKSLYNYYLVSIFFEKNLICKSW